MVHLQLWLTLSERFIESRNINWSKTSKFCFNEKCNPEDDSLGTQIVKVRISIFYNIIKFLSNQIILMKDIFQTKIVKR